jgi:hypothetical protein
MQTVVLASGWEHHQAPAATLLDGLGPPLLWWGVAVVLLAGGLLLLDRRPAWSVVLALLATPALGIATNGLVDDAYIQFRYADNLAEGHGPVFNPGERLEGASGGLWIAVLAIACAVTGTGPAIAGRLLSLAAGALATWSAAALGQAAGGARGAGAAALVWAALPTPVLYAATGLETAAFAAALLAVGAGIAFERRLAASLSGALIAALRPEGMVLGLAALPWWRRSGHTGRLALGALLGAGAGIAVARLLYYGLPVPRPAIVKGLSAPAGITSGLVYLGEALLEWWPLLTAVPILIRRRSSIAPVLSATLTWTVLVVTRGGDWMPGGRYLLPLLALLVAGTAALAPGRRARLAVAAAVAWGLVQLAPLERPSRSPLGGAWRAMAEHRVQSRWWESLGAWLRRSMPPGARLAAGPVGALPYAAGLPTFDMYGLCSDVAGGREGEAGHRLWGLREAVSWGAEIIYPGQGLPQTGDWPEVLEAAERQVEGEPAVRERYRPLAISHDPEYRLDMIKDIIWIRRDAPGSDRTSGRCRSRGHRSCRGPRRRRSGR